MSIHWNATPQDLFFTVLRRSRGRCLECSVEVPTGHVVCAAHTPWYEAVERAIAREQEARDLDAAIRASGAV